jgi:hypothetical protein
VSEWLSSLTSKPHVYTTDMASSPYYRSQVLGFADTFVRPWVSLITSLYVQIFFPDESDNHNIAESDDRHQNSKRLNGCRSESLIAKDQNETERYCCFFYPHYFN